jgi:hypothetical protein
MPGWMANLLAIARLHWVVTCLLRQLEWGNFKSKGQGCVDTPRAQLMMVVDPEATFHSGGEGQSRGGRNWHLIEGGRFRACEGGGASSATPAALGCALPSW